VTVVVSAGGRVVLPKAMRERLGWAAGTRLVVERVADGVLLRREAAVFARTREADVFGSLAHAGVAKTVEEVGAGVAAEARRRHARGRF
jgi:AbrB family looped-hinge helix DNA binding protein